MNHIQINNAVVGNMYSSSNNMYMYSDTPLTCIFSKPRGCTYIYICIILVYFSKPLYMYISRPWGCYFIFLSLESVLSRIFGLGGKLWGVLALSRVRGPGTSSPWKFWILCCQRCSKEPIFKFFRGSSSSLLSEKDSSPVFLLDLLLWKLLNS